MEFFCGKKLKFFCISYNLNYLTFRLILFTLIMDNKKENLSRFGIATKGFVYILIGGLTVMAAAGVGGNTSGSSGALSSLSSSLMGKILLAITALGLAGYVFWRSYQAIADPDGKGTDAKGITVRAAYLISAVFYVFLAFTAVQILLGGGGGGGGGQETLVGKALTKPFGQVLVGIVALLFFGKAAYQMYRAYSGKYKEKLKQMDISEKARKLVFAFGVAGYSARGAVIGIIAFLTLKAALSSDSSKAGGTKDAFQYVQDEFGTVVLAIMAFGLFLYGVFVLIKARYRDMHMA